ncbi:hypothetical protein AC249_AIPGENE15222 [Exaiptasia diaphana]|nr:hypothetical protein AC249_AIPGENE15222 [Exaiptasia diaphana]
MSQQGLTGIVGETSHAFLKSLRPPDWALLYFKLESRIPDEGWQTLTNITNLGRTGAVELVFAFLQHIELFVVWSREDSMMFF